MSDARLFDAASSLGALLWRTFRSVTWSSSRHGDFRSIVFGIYVNYY